LRAIAPDFDQVFLSVGPSSAEAELARRLAAVAPDKVHVPTGPLPWSQLAALLQGARLFLGVDTAALHVAAACQCPLVALWGPASAVVFGPLSPRSAIALDDRIARAPFGPDAAHDDARIASRNSVATVRQAIAQVLGA